MRHHEVFVLAGQSNMDGRGDSALLVGGLSNYVQAFPAVSIVYANGATVLAGEPQPLAVGFAVPPGKVDPPTPRFGPEITFGRRMAAAMPGKNILLIKFTKGGTSLHKDWAPESPESLYHHMLKFTRQTLERITAKGNTYTLHGFAWHQGESDEALAAGEYSRLFAAFAARVRRDLDMPAVPIVVGEVLDQGNRQTVIAELRSLPSKVARCGLVSIDGLTSYDGGTHFDAPSVIKLGERYAEAMLAMMRSN